MSNIPAELKYVSSHEWLRLEDDGTVTVGITEHAQELLGDIVFVELPEVGANLAADEQAGENAGVSGRRNRRDGRRRHLGSAGDSAGAAGNRRAPAAACVRRVDFRADSGARLDVRRRGGDFS